MVPVGEATRDGGVVGRILSRFGARFDRAEDGKKEQRRPSPKASEVCSRPLSEHAARSEECSLVRQKPGAVSSAATAVPTASFLNIRETRTMSFALRILTTLDRAILAAYCNAYGLWAEATEAIQKYGTMVKSLGT